MVFEIQNDPSYNINTSIFSIGNVALFAIISTKIEKVKRHGVEFTLNTAGTIGSIPHIKVYELCEIIGIYLDNAIEAAELSTKKNINMSVIEYIDSIDIKITNSCDKMPVMGKLKQYGYSTKGVNRGHGLSIAEKILKKYKAVFNIMTFDESVMQFNQEIKIKRLKSLFYTYFNSDLGHSGWYHPKIQHAEAEDVAANIPIALRTVRTINFIRLFIIFSTSHFFDIWVAYLHQFT